MLKLQIIIIHNAYIYIYIYLYIAAMRGMGKRRNTVNNQTRNGVASRNSGPPGSTVGYANRMNPAMSQSQFQRTNQNRGYPPQHVQQQRATQQRVTQQRVTQQRPNQQRRGPPSRPHPQ